MGEGSRPSGFIVKSQFGNHIVMSSLFDPLNLILLAVALVVLWRLRSVLGTRTGHERPPMPAPAANPRRDQEPAVNDGPPLGVDDREPPKPVWHGVAAEGSDVAKALESIAARSPGFDANQFLDGAKLAYEMILQAYAAGDKAALRPLLGNDVLQSFGGAIDRRKTDGAHFVFQFVGVKSASLSRAALDGRNAQLTVCFHSEMIQALVAKDGTVLEGNDKGIRVVEDIWTFERDVTSRDPNWKLVATDDDIG